MKNSIQYIFVALVLVDVGLQGLTYYRQHGAQPAAMSPAPAGTTIDIADRPLQGDPKTRIVILEFSDFECPFCRRHTSTVLPHLRQQYISNGKVRYGFVNNPLPIHANARLLATAAICAKDRFWQMHDALFEQQPKAKPEIVKIGHDIGLEQASFERCLDDPATNDAVERDLRIAEHTGLKSTPAFGVGLVNGTGQVTIQTIITGAQPLEIFDKAIATTKM
jgi:protein-disulfide isomerase